MALLELAAKLPLTDLPSVLNPASPEGEAVLRLFWVVLVIAAVVFVSVAVPVGISIVRFRRRSGDPVPKQVMGHDRIEILWTALPFAVLLVLFGVTVSAMHAIQPPVRDREPDLDVVAHQWWWEGHYRKTGVVVANEFHFPAGQTLLLRFNSADVIHDWWVPRLGRKMDIFPNHHTYLWMHPERPGRYLGTCDEFCGAEHAWMRIRVVVDSPDDYRRWTEQQLRTPGDPADAMGLALYRKLPCASCHGIEGTSAAAIGPDLTHVGSRDTLGAGIMDNNLDNLTRWIRNPQTIKPKCHMPNMQLGCDDARHIARYLEGLR